MTTGSPRASACLRSSGRGGSAARVAWGPARALCVAALALSIGCAGTAPTDPSPDGPAKPVIEAVEPLLLLPTSALSLRVRNFSAEATHQLLLEGDAAGKKVSWSAELLLSEQRLVVTDLSGLTAQGSEGRLDAELKIHSQDAWGEATSDAFAVSFELRTRLVPRLDAVATGLIHLNGLVQVEGEGLLLGGKEGYTRAEVKGCFLAEGSTLPCVQVSELVDVDQALSVDRARGAFRFVPRIAGISPGRFDGELTLINESLDGNPQRSATRPLSLELQRSRLDGFAQPSVSLGQYLDLDGKGFAGGAEGVTVIAFSGTFTPDGGEARALSRELIPRFVDGEHLRYVFEEEVGLGELIDLRKEQGVLEGSWVPRINWGEQQEEAQGAVIALRITPVKQVVHVKFTAEWAHGLRPFGLQAADKVIRQRVFDVLERDYSGINVEFRADVPEDYALYTQIEISGADPNGLGLFGYDNTPGKDVNNERLGDRIGGVNALTREDGYPGYGGIFVESMLGFSMHPPDGVYRAPNRDALFDEIFDPVRPDEGRSASSSEVADAPELVNMASCPAKERAAQVACAMRVLGNLVGHTASHELGHALGLADPYGAPTTYHNAGDVPNRMMEDAMGRPFAERAQLDGQGPAMFCDSEFTYLRALLSTNDPDPQPRRPSCR